MHDDVGLRVRDTWYGVQGACMVLLHGSHEVAEVELIFVPAF